MFGRSSEATFYCLVPQPVVLLVQRAGRERVFLCKCNFLEIYKEVITDLLNPAATRLHIREDAKSTTYVEGLSETIVSTGMLC